MQMQMTTNSLNRMRDPMLCDLDYVRTYIHEVDSAWEAQYGPYRLMSNFQPIYSLAHQDIVGYEGLVRAHGYHDEGKTPESLFESGREDFEEVFLDRLSRYLHCQNFSRQGNRHDWLFLNISPKVVVCGKQYGDYFQSLLASAGIDPGRVVIEIVEQEIEDEAKLAEAAEYYRNMGCLIAIDDFGKGHSNFSRIWQLRPEIVKLDRDLIHQATQSENTRRILKRLVSLIHESGSLVLVEGVETEYEAFLAIDSGADFVQGYYFSRPQKQLLDSQIKSQKFQHLCDMYRSNTEYDYEQSSEKLSYYGQMMMQSAADMESGLSMRQACASLLALRQVKRCFLLDEEGWLRGQMTDTSRDAKQQSSKFIPLRREKGMVWSQWREFLEAWKARDTVHMGAQHISLDDGRLCRTLSISLSVDGERFLLCCDVESQGQGDISGPPNRFPTRLPTR